MSSGGGDIRAGKAYVEVGVKDTLDRGLRAAGKKLRVFGAGIGAIGASVGAAGGAIITPLMVAVDQFAEFGAALFDASKRTSVSASTLSEFRYAAEQTGGTIEDVEKGFKGLSKTFFDASKGGKAATAALDEIGLSAKDLEGLSPDQQFMKVAEALNQYDDSATKAAVASKIFGKAGMQLLPMMGELVALRAEARGLGLVISDEDAAKADELDDAYTRLAETWKGIKTQVGAGLAQTMIDVLGVVQNGALAVKDFVVQNRQLFVTIAQVGAVLSLAGAALVGIGVTIAATGFLFTGIASAIGVASAAIAGFVSIAGTAFAAITSPIGLALVAVTALGAAILYYTGAGGDALSWLGERASSFASTFGEVLGGIRDALLAGDISLAAKILWAGVRLEFDKALGSLGTSWDQIWFGMATMFDTWVTNLRMAFVQLTTFIAGALLKLVDLANKALSFVGASTGIDAQAAQSELAAMSTQKIGSLAGGLAGRQVGRNVALAQGDSVDELQSQLDDLLDEASTARKESELARRNPPPLPEVAEFDEANVTKLNLAASAVGAFSPFASMLGFNTNETKSQTIELKAIRRAQERHLRLAERGMLFG